MRVVPEGPGVGESETVDKRFSRFDRALHHIRPVHRGRYPQPVPVEGRRLGKAIREAHLEHVPHAGLDRRPRDLAVESPAFHGSTGSDRPLELSRLEVHRNDGPAGVGSRGVKRLAVCSARVSRRRMYDGTVMVGCVMMRRVIVF